MDRIDVPNRRAWPTAPAFELRHQPWLSKHRSKVRSLQDGDSLHSTVIHGVYMYKFWSMSLCTKRLQPVAGLILVHGEGCCTPSSCAPSPHSYGNDCVPASSKRRGHGSGGNGGTEAGCRPLRGEQDRRRSPAQQWGRGSSRGWSRPRPLPRASAGRHQLQLRKEGVGGGQAPQWASGPQR